ncbi:MAG TPA: ZIP family metal transporter [Candidatus Limnocylindria bacterium]|nr:ZIP family metal transporter [Candidatus Limnocylindria bacterium]
MTPLVLLLGLAAALGDLIGGAIVAVPRRIGDRTLTLLMALGAGNLLGVSVVELIPESINEVGEAAPLYILAGYLLIHFFEHVFAPHLHFGEETHEDSVVDTHVSSTAILGLGLHAFMDGVAIGSAFIASPALGTIVFAAIMLHKLPEGFTIASVMKATGAGRRGTLGAAALLSVATFSGVVATGLLSGFAGPALALATGSVLYVGATDLMSEANKEFGILNPLMVIIGIGMFFALVGLAGLAGIEV